MEKYKTNLNQLWDGQLLLLAQLSCLDFDVEKYEDMKLQGNTVTMWDLLDVLSHPRGTSYGVPANEAQEVTGIDVGKQYFKLMDINSVGFRDLVITDIACDSNIDFKAIAFEDTLGNRGMSFCGTNFKEIFRDIDDNLPKHLKESSEQVEAAKIFYEHNRRDDGKNYLFGHSLGGTLVEHNYVENHDEIAKAYIFNGVPIDKELIDTEEKVDAFNDEDKCFIYAVGGDYATLSKDISELEPYQENIRFIKNKWVKNNLVSNHLIECIQYEDGRNFIEYSMKEAYFMQKYSPKKPRRTSELTVDDVLDYIEEKLTIVFDKVGEYGKKAFDKIKNIINEKSSNGVKLLGDGKK